MESFNGKLRDELLEREIFYSLEEAKVLIEMWRKHYNTVRPHSSLGYKPPAPESISIGVKDGGVSRHVGIEGFSPRETPVRESHCLLHGKSSSDSHSEWYDFRGNVSIPIAATSLQGKLVAYETRQSLLRLLIACGPNEPFCSHANRTN